MQVAANDAFPHRYPARELQPAHVWCMCARHEQGAVVFSLCDLAGEGALGHVPGSEGGHADKGPVGQQVQLLPEWCAVTAVTSRHAAPGCSP